MPTRPNANKISSKTHKWLGACVYGNLSLLLPPDPCNQSPKSFPYDGETLWTPAMGTGPFSRACGRTPAVLPHSLERGGSGLARSQVRTPAESGLQPHPTAFVPICLPPSMHPEPLSESVDHLPRISGMTAERKFPRRGNSLSCFPTRSHL